MSRREEYEQKTEAILTPKKEFVRGVQSRREEYGLLTPIEPGSW